LGSPLKTAWELAKAWPDAELKVIDDSGHTGNGVWCNPVSGSPAMSEATAETIERFGKTVC
jgi:proline iminopeptidase